MISNQILQNTLDGLKAISRVDFAVIDTDGKTIVSTTENELEYPAAVVDFVKSPADSQEVSRYQFFKIYDEQVVEYVLVAIGSGEDVYMIGKMATFQIQNLMVAYKERFDNLKCFRPYVATLAIKTWLNTDVNICISNN